MTRPGFEPAPPASEANALTIRLSGPVVFQKHLSVFSPRLEGGGGGWRAVGMQGELDSKDYLDRA